MKPDACFELPPQLASFPEKARDAYRRYRVEGDRTAAQEVVLAVLANFLPDENAEKRTARLSDQMHLVNDLGYDSLAIAEIVFFLEDLFGVVIKTADLRHVQTVGDLRSFVDEKLAHEQTQV